MSIRRPLINKTVQTNAITVPSIRNAEPVYVIARRVISMGHDPAKGSVPDKEIPLNLVVATWQRLVSCGLLWKKNPTHAVRGKAKLVIT